MHKLPLHVLLADDDEDDRLIFKDALEEVKVKTRVTIVNDGVQLMDYLLQADNELPSIIFLDLNMPGKSGMECLQDIRNHKDLKTSRLPFILLLLQRRYRGYLLKRSQYLYQKPRFCLSFKILQKSLPSIGSIHVRPE
jgi:CheY-like chemotaxis protein